MALFQSVRCSKKTVDVLETFETKIQEHLTLIITHLNLEYSLQNMAVQKSIN